MSGKQKKYYTIKISRTELCFWIIGGIFALFWMFILGILVGQEVIYLPKVSQVHLSFLERYSSGMPSSKANPQAGTKATPLLKSKLPSYQAKPKAKPESTQFSFVRSEKKAGGSRKVTSTKIKERQYTIQIGSFTKKENATSLQNKLKKQGYKVFIKSAKINTRTYYRVYVGPYPLKKALNYYADLSNQYYHPAKPTPVP
ncbi:MAG: SPOR domain-containing protein [Candidatus Desulfofervidaceae bacterium]|nr:SPOR domain-containing protein [Candidatus Desulfofervidaceae bacterium]